MLARGPAPVRCHLQVNPVTRSGKQTLQTVLSEVAGTGLTRLELSGPHAGFFLVPLSQVLTKRWSCSVVTPRTLTGRGARFPGPRPGLNRSPQRPAPPAFGRGQRPLRCVLPVRAPIRLPEETAEWEKEAFERKTASVRNHGWRSRSGGGGARAGGLCSPRLLSGRTVVFIRD